jgi:hypothetical protein
MPTSRRLFLEATLGLAGLGTAYAAPPQAAVDPAFEFPEIARRLKREEYEEAVLCARRLGLTNVDVQGWRG